jgi:hypothetical protein
MGVKNASKNKQTGNIQIKSVMKGRRQICFQDKSRFEGKARLSLPQECALI